MVMLIVMKRRQQYFSGVMDRVKMAGYSVGDVSDETIDMADRVKSLRRGEYHLRCNEP